MLRFFLSVRMGVSYPTIRSAICLLMMTKMQDDAKVNIRLSCLPPCIHFISQPKVFSEPFLFSPKNPL